MACLVLRGDDFARGECRGEVTGAWEEALAKDKRGTIVGGFFKVGADSMRSGTPGIGGLDTERLRDASLAQEA